MKIESPDTETRPDPRRRRLLLGVSGGVALASPLALVGCGGGGGGDGGDGDDAGGSDAVDPEVLAVVARLPAASRSATAVKVALPAGASVAYGSVKLVSANNVSEVTADGSAGVVVISNAPQMSYLIGDDGRLLLMSVVEPGRRTTVDSRGTAEALLLIASEAARQGPAVELAIRRGLADARLDAVVEPVRLAVEAALGRGGIGEDDAALLAALGTATKALRLKSTMAPAKGRRREAVTIAPEAAQSGVTVQPADDFNSIVLENAYRRRTHVWLKRTGSYDAAGAYSPVAPPVESLAAPAKSDFDLDTTTSLSFDTLVTSIGDYVTQFYADIGWLGEYESGNAVFGATRTGVLNLPFAPDTAQVAEHKVRVVGIGGRSDGTLTPAEEAALAHLQGVTLFEDIAKPFLRNLVLPMLSEAASANFSAVFEGLVGSLLLQATLDLSSMTVARTYFPLTAEAIANGDLKGVISQFASEFFSSNTFQEIYLRALRAYVQASGNAWTLRDGAGRLIGVNLLDDQTLTLKKVEQLKGALTKLARVILAIKAATLVGDYAAQAHDWRVSSRISEFTVNLSKAKVTLSPKPFEVPATGGQKAITIKVEGLDAAVPASSVFVQWTCTGKYGNLYQVGGSGIDDFESALASSPTHNYIPTGIEADPADPDVVTATAFYRNPSTNGRIEMGSATLTVVFKKEFTLLVSPNKTTTLGTDLDFPLSAFVVEKLPMGATVDWEWTHGGVGSLVAGAATGRPAESGVVFKSGPADGAARATVRARITVPGSAAVPARVVQAEAVRTDLVVRKGTRELKFDASAGIFACGTGCGVSEYTAYIVPKIAGATNYHFENSNPAGVVYRIEDWTSTKPDRGGNYFPITNHPFPGGTGYWAVWVGFGGKPDPAYRGAVTITLPA